MSESVGQGLEMNASLMAPDAKPLGLPPNSPPFLCPRLETHTGTNIHMRALTNMLRHSNTKYPGMCA